MSQRLLYVSSEAAVFLQHRGVPVWPVCSRVEHEALQSIASTFSARLEVVTATTPAAAFGPPTRLRRGVLALVEACSAVAELYAHLTSRPWSVVNAGGVTSALLDETDVIVARLSDLTPALLDACQRVDRLVGLIAAADPDELRLQALVRAAAVALAGSPTVPAQVHVSGWLECERTMVRDNLYLGTRASPEEIGSALASRAALLAISCHADGMDASLGPRVMCGMAGLGATGDPERSPACHATQFCHRLSLPLGEALASDLVLDPSTCAAQLVVMHCCFGVMPENALIDPAWSLGARLAGSAGVGALLTTWELQLTHVHGSDRLSNALAQGKPVGSAGAEFVEWERVRHGTRLCLFGDPALALAPQHDEAYVFPESNEVRDVAWRFVGSTEDIVDPGSGAGASLVGAAPEQSDLRLRRGQSIEFLHAYLQLKAEQPTTPLLEEAIGRAQAALAEAELTTLFGGRRMRGALKEAFLQVCTVIAISGLKAFTNDWLRMAIATPCVGTNFECPVCGTSAKRHDVPLALHTLYARRVLMCPRCGVVEDAPRHAMPLQLRYDAQGRARVEGALPADPWAGVFVLAPPVESCRRFWRWPEDAAGLPSSQFAVNADYPGPHHVGVLMISEDGPLLVRRPRRGKHLFVMASADEPLAGLVRR